MLRRLAALLTMGVVAVTATTLATGALSSSESAVPVCVNENSGTIRVATDCNPAEYPLTLGGGSTGFRTVTVTRDFDQPIGEYLPPVEVIAACNAGERVVGGGGSAVNETWGIGSGPLVASRPGVDNASWIAAFPIYDGITHATAYAICAS